MYTEMSDDYSFARPHLAPGETILWRGKPEKGHLFSGQDVILIPFSILWCGFAIFWFATALMHTPLPFALFGVPFVCVGLYISVGRFFHITSVRKNTAYVITTQKVIRRRGKRIDMLDARTMPPSISPPTPTAPAPSSSVNLYTIAAAESVPACGMIPGVPAIARLPWRTSPMWPMSSRSSTPSPEIKDPSRCNREKIVV